MTTPPEPLALAADFPAGTRQDWRELVRAVLVRAGRSAAETAAAPGDLLTVTTDDGVSIAPRYTADDPAPEPGLPGLPPFTRAGRPEGGTSTGWDVRARYADADPAAVNAAALADLEHGVSSLWLAVGAAGVPVDALPGALAGVIWMLFLSQTTLSVPSLMGAIMA
ncbi:MAG TPA: methylmalonyl-CoA mutase family protein, partial [Pseudonocardiaceae bacterium]|nr:methylmalonyl-CoA mutase family protein [Pseudonocardiaceae bacterium]